jgi:hypothetical protein
LKINLSNSLPKNIKLLIIIAVIIAGEATFFSNRCCPIARWRGINRSDNTVAVGALALRRNKPSAEKGE